METKVKPRNMYAEYTILTKYFGTESMNLWFNNYQWLSRCKRKSNLSTSF